MGEFLIFFNAFLVRRGEFRSSEAPMQVVAGCALYGVVELAYRERADPEPTSGAIGPALLVGCMVLAVASIVRKK